VAGRHLRALDAATFGVTGRKIFDLHQDEGEAPIQSRAQWRLTGISTMHSNNRYWLEHDPVALAVLLIGFGVELFVFSI
jgi:hypothetical protein